MSIFCQNFDTNHGHVDRIDMRDKYVEIFAFFRHICHKLRQY